VDITGQTVFASATNLDEVTASTIGPVSAYNMYDVDVTGQTVFASATNLDEIPLYELASSANLQAVDNNVDVIVEVLPAGGDIIAGQSDIEAILVNTRFKATVPTQVIVPETGYYPYELIVHLYNSLGLMEDPDNDKLYVQIKAVSGTTYKTELYDDVGVTTPATSGTDSVFTPQYYEMVKVDTGYYHLFYKLSASEISNQWVATFGYTELSASQFHSRTTVILEQTPGVSTLADSVANKTIIRESMGLTDGAEASIDTKLNDIYVEMGTSATQQTINTNVLAIPTDNNGITVSASNLDEVDVTGQTVFASATNLDEVDISGQAVSANNLDEVDVTGQTVFASATNLSEVDINGQVVSASNLDEVTSLTIGSVSAYNMYDVNIAGQSVSANNLDEVDINGQTVSANNLDEVTDQTIGAVSAYNINDVDLSGVILLLNGIDNTTTSIDATTLATSANVETIVSALPENGGTIAGQSVSANNLDEVTSLTIGSVSAYNMYDVNIAGQSVSAKLFQRIVMLH